MSKLLQSAGIEALNDVNLTNIKLELQQYLENYHDITSAKILDLLEDTARKRTGNKPNVEAFIEKALGYDFNMSKYAKDLHKYDAVSKKDLKLK
jgi:hypothetical protein